MIALFKKVKIYGLRKSLLYSLIEIKHLLFDRLFKGSYSQRGEDLVVDELLGHKRSGFYVDVGAQHPFRSSNTARFYRRGWTGINIEPDPASFSRLAEARGRDINLNIGIGLAPCSLPFFRFFPDGFSTFSADDAALHKELGFELVETFDVQIRRLQEVLSEFCGERTIDFMSIDTEGFEREVLLSNDWERFKPTMIIIESAQADGSLSASFADYEEVLTNAGYELVTNNGLNAIYSLHRAGLRSGLAHAG